jgi:DNA (cytosine-5)-methyltransferase 1
MIASSLDAPPITPATPSSPAERRYVACDLFAGCGGLSEGLAQAGLEVAVANEVDPDAARTYALNQPNTRLIIGDIREKKIKDAICACFKEKPCDVLAAGIPCQSWSLAGRRQGFNDSRGLLWFDYLEMLRRLKPRLTVAETVTGMRSHPEALSTILNIFGYLGYRAEYKILNSADHGVPQIRRRLFFVAVRCDSRDLPFIWPKPTHTKVVSGGQDHV